MFLTLPVDCPCRSWEEISWITELAQEEQPYLDDVCLPSWTLVRKGPWIFCLSQVIRHQLHFSHEKVHGFSSLFQEDSISLLSNNILLSLSEETSVLGWLMGRVISEVMGILIFGTNVYWLHKERKTYNYRVGECYLDIWVSERRLQDGN